MKPTLRDRLVGTPLLGFDTTRWVRAGDVTPTPARIGAKGQPTGGGGTGGNNGGGGAVGGGNTGNV